MPKRKNTRTKVFCYCEKCDGKLTDPRTKASHMSKKRDIPLAGPSTVEMEIDDETIETDEDETGYNDDDIIYSDNEMHDPLPEINDLSPKPLSERNYLFLTKKLPIHESTKFQNVKKGKFSDRVLENLSLDDDDNDDHIEDSEDNDDDQNSDFDSDEEEESDDYEKINFASPDFDSDEPKIPPYNNSTYTWVVLWILQYQQRYKLSNVATDSLFKFLSSFLLTLNASMFSSFPSTLYMAKKKLGIPKICQYAACNKCHKLYDINEILNKPESSTCSFVNYPNHSMERYRKKCDNPLLKTIDTALRPIMTFPLVNVKQQLALFYGRRDFETSCRKWAEREVETEALFDIYDGMV